MKNQSFVKLYIGFYSYSGAQVTLIFLVVHTHCSRWDLGEFTAVAINLVY